MTVCMRSFVALATVTLVAALPVTDVFGQGSVSDKGQYTFVTSVESVSLPGGQTLQRAVQNGLVLADNPESPLHESATTCSGGAVVSASGEPGIGYGHCDAIDKDGDIWTLWFRNDGSGGPWGYINGTGKFQGIEGGGTWTAGPQWPDGRGINNWEGTYTLKR